MSTCNNKPKCIHCGVMDSYTANKLEYRVIGSDTHEFVCSDCAEEIRREKRQLAIREHQRKSAGMENESYRAFIEKHLFKMENMDLLPEEYKTEFILNQEKQLEYQKKVFYSFLNEYKSLTSQVHLLHLSRMQELNLQSQNNFIN